MTGTRKALLATAVVALLTVPGIAMASGAFVGGDDHVTIVEDQANTTGIEPEASLEAADDSVADLAEDSSDDLSGDLDEATEAEDSSDDLSGDLDEATEVEDSPDDLGEAFEADDSSDEDSSDDLDEADDDGLVDEEITHSAADAAGIHN